MRLHDLTAEQLEILRDSLRPKLRYLKRLRVRMEETRFSQDDRFFRDVMMAEILLRDSLEMIEGAWSIKGSAAGDRRPKAR